MDLVEIPAIAGTIGAAVGAAIVGYRKHAKRRRHKSSDVQRAIAAQQQIYASLQETLRETGADRVILLKAHNGGRIIEQSTSQIYLTIFAEVTPGEVHSVQQDFQSRPCYDHRYLDLLRRVGMTKSVTIYTDRMDDDEMLRGVYESANIGMSVVTEVLERTGEYWYMSTSWANPKELRPADHSVIAGHGSKIRSVIDKDLFR